MWLCKGSTSKQMKSHKIGHWRISNLFTVTRKTIWDRRKGGAVLKTSTQSQNRWLRTLLTTSKNQTTITTKGLSTTTKRTIIVGIRYTNRLKSSDNMKNTKHSSPRGAQINAWTDPCPHQAFPTRTTATREDSRFPLPSTKFGAPLKISQTPIITLPIIRPPNCRKSTLTRQGCKERPIWTIEH